MTPNPTPEEMPAIPPDQLQRMRELAVTVAATGHAVRRMDSKSDEPAGVFRVPLA